MRHSYARAMRHWSTRLGRSGPPAWLTPTLYVAIVSLGLSTPSLSAQANCPGPNKPAVCAALVPGTPPPFPNPAAPARLDLSKSRSFELVILGHSESRGYHTHLRRLLQNSPLLAGKTFTVYNDYIGGTEAYRWSAPGQRGFDRITQVLKRRQSPMIVLGLLSNNASFPVKSSSAANANFKRFVATRSRARARSWSFATTSRETVRCTPPSSSLAPANISGFSIGMGPRC